MKKRLFFLLCIILLLLASSAPAETVPLSRLPLESSDSLTPVLAPFADACPATLPELVPEEDPELEIIGRVAAEDDWWFIAMDDEEETERYAWIRVRATPPLRQLTWSSGEKCCLTRAAVLSGYFRRRLRIPTIRPSWKCPGRKC